jgi:hypothetical protein
MTALRPSPRFPLAGAEPPPINPETQGLQRWFLKILSILSLAEARISRP